MGWGQEEKQREGRGPDLHPEPKEEPPEFSPEVCALGPSQPGSSTQQPWSPPVSPPLPPPLRVHLTPTCGAVGRADQRKNQLSYPPPSLTP